MDDAYVLPDVRRVSSEIPLEEALSALDRFFESAGETTRTSYRIIGSVTSLTSADMFGEQTRSDEDVGMGGMIRVVNFANEEGYAVLGADSRLDTVLVVGDRGNIDPLVFTSAGSDGSYGRPHPIEIDADDLYCAEYDEYYLGDMYGGENDPYIVGALVRDYTQMRTIAVGNKELAEGIVGICPRPISPMLETKWRQGFPFNMNVEHYFSNGSRCPIGCTTTAAIQILTYLKNRDLKYHFGIENSTWQQLEQYGLLSEYPDGYQYTQQDYDLAKLGISAANGIGVKYKYQGSNGTFAVPAKVKSYFEDLGYDVDKLLGFDSKTQSRIISSLRNNVPVFVGALGTNSGKLGGHAWVIDGYRFDKPSACHYNHCNFGWGGRSNGWFCYNLFNSKDENVEFDEPDLGNSRFRYHWWFRTLIIN